MIDKPEIKELVIEHVDHGYDTGLNANWNMHKMQSRYKN